MKQLKDAPVTGRLIAEFDLDILRAMPEKDTILEDGDEIIIPYITQQVYVQGEVGNPGAIRHKPGENLNYYLNGSCKYHDICESLNCICNSSKWRK